MVIPSPVSSGFANATLLKYFRAADGSHRVAHNLAFSGSSILRWQVCVGCLLASQVAVASEVDSYASKTDIDTDDDGLSDSLERRTGTSQLRVDSDGDGVPDGVEDIDHDGRVDPGESNPRISGLFPGRYPHIPEPMVFDMVRGLGARKGELEVNSLAVVRLNRGRPELSWAPEIEWAFRDNLAVELEVPMVDHHLDALKIAFQGTMPKVSDAISQGAQFIGEYLLSTHDAKAVALYIVGRRIGGWSLLGMGGARVLQSSARRPSV